MSGVGGPVWRAGERVFDCSERTLVMGIVNVTPDSFSDGGRFATADDAVRHAMALADDGADIVDIGGESTRPGSDAVPADEEIARVLPVIARLADERPALAISIDTRKAEVAAAALDGGAVIVNDVSAGRDPGMLPLVAERGAAIVLMHLKGEPETMQEAPAYDDVVSEVRAHLGERIEAAERSGIDRERIAVDPGIGFGKELGHNLELIRRVDALLDLGRPILVGPSRKRFIGAILDLPEDQRVEGTIGAVVWMVARGAHAVRVHDVREVSRAVRVADAIARAGA
jgi:dihydropteroate synthase